MSTEDTYKRQGHHITNPRARTLRVRGFKVRQASCIYQPYYVCPQYKLTLTANPTGFASTQQRTIMPSFLKKLLLGKDLSNPYVNKYHVGHRATQQSAQDPHPTSLTLSTRIPPRPESPTYLEEARRLAGRDPVTGRALGVQHFAAGAERSGEGLQTRQTGWDQRQSEPQRMAVGMEGQQERYDATMGDQRRKWSEAERAAAEQLRVREVGGYFTPERSVREYYGGS